MSLRGNRDASFDATNVDTINERTADNGVEIDGVLLKDGGAVLADGATLEVDTINEATSTNGVSIEGVLLKDGDVSITGGNNLKVDGIAEYTTNEGVTIDSVLIKDRVLSVNSGTLRVETDHSTAGGDLILNAGSSSNTNSSIELRTEDVAKFTIDPDGGGYSRIRGHSTTGSYTAYESASTLRLISGGGNIQFWTNASGSSNDNGTHRWSLIDGATELRGESAASITTSSGNLSLVPNSGTVAIGSTATTRVEATSSKLSFFSGASAEYATIGRSDGGTLGGGSGDDDLYIGAAGGIRFQGDINDNGISASMVHPFEFYSFDGAEVGTNNLLMRIRANGTLNVDTINELTSANGVTIDGVSVKDNSVDLGHTDSTAMNYFEVYSNDALLEDTNVGADTGVIQIGDLNILRINNFCILSFRFDGFNSPTDGEAIFDIPSRFQPAETHRARQVVGSNLSDEFLFIEVFTTLKIGKHNFSGTKVNFGADERFNGSICYTLS